MNIKIEKNSWGYEIDFWFLTDKEKRKLSDKVGMNSYENLGCYYKSGENWTHRISGMSFNITESNYYPKLKIFLDSLLNIYLRKQKLLKISDIEKIKSCNV
jgi:hypothetical protein